MISEDENILESEARQIRRLGKHLYSSVTKNSVYIDTITKNTEFDL